MSEIQCRCKGNVICSNHWTTEHTRIYKLQQRIYKGERI